MNPYYCISSKTIREIREMKSSHVCINSHKVYFRIINIFCHERRLDGNSECISAEQYRFLYIVFIYITFYNRIDFCSQ